jgi:hypothetical protein
MFLHRDLIRVAFAAGTGRGSPCALACHPGATAAASLFTELLPVLVLWHAPLFMHAAVQAGHTRVLRANHRLSMLSFPLVFPPETGGPPEDRLL